MTIPKLGDTCQELRGQSSEKGGHHYPSWNVKEWKERDPKRAKMTTQVGRQVEKPKNRGSRRANTRDPKRNDNIISRSGYTCKEWRAQRSQKGCRRLPGHKCQDETKVKH